MASVFNLMIADQVEALLDGIAQDHGGPGRCGDPEDRARITGAIHALLWMYVSRPGGVARAHAWMDLMESLGLDDAPADYTAAPGTPEHPAGQDR